MGRRGTEEAYDVFVWPLHLFFSEKQCGLQKYLIHPARVFFLIFDKIDVGPSVLRKIKKICNMVLLCWVVCWYAWFLANNVI